MDFMLLNATTSLFFASVLQSPRSRSFAGFIRVKKIENQYPERSENLIRLILITWVLAN